MFLIINILSVIDKYVLFGYYNKKYISYLEIIGVYQIIFCKGFYDFKRYAISAKTSL